MGRSRPDTSFEGFIEHVRDAVEREAQANEENRWWILAPSLLVERGDDRLDSIELVPALVERPLGRALVNGDPAAILEAVGARRCAVTLHADLDIDGDVVPAIVVAALGRMAVAVFYAPVERTDYGTPRLGEWRAGALGEAELFGALGRTLAPPP